MPNLRLENLFIRYGALDVVKDVSFEVADREYCVLLGPSGCGKTTVLRAIAGFNRPASGHVLIDGLRVDHLYPGDRNLAMIFQSYALYPHLTVRGNFLFPLQAARTARSEAEGRIREIAGLLHMEELLERYPRELSGGQQQRVAVGRALIRHCPILLLDEPLGNLDAKLRVEMRATLKRLQRDLGITAVHVTHDQVEALALADRVVVMEGGRVRQTGSADDVYDRPENLFVAGFIGTPAMNFLSAEVASDGPRVRCDLGEITLAPGAGDAFARAQAGRRVVLGVRPEHLRVSRTAGAGRAPVPVSIVEPQGSEEVIDLELAPERMIRARVAKEELQPRPQPGETLHVGVLAPHLHFFDPDTGARLGL